MDHYHGVARGEGGTIGIRDVYILQIFSVHVQRCCGDFDSDLFSHESTLRPCRRVLFVLEVVTATKHVVRTMANV